jgi:GPH family glycoside/pentoside/hexuronide:cation symporter
MSSESSGPIAAPSPGQLDQPGSAALDNSPVVYGLGFFGLASTAQALAGYYLFFYVDVLGLSVALAASINVVYAIWDAVNDPLAGYLSDNTRSRWGRRRPWLLAGLPFYLILFVLIYAVPGAFRQGNALFWYALVVIFLWETAATVISMNYQALFPELFQGFKRRARASAYSQGLGSAGELVGFALTPIVYAAFGFEAMAILFAVNAGILVLIAILRSSEDPGAQAAAPLNFKESFSDVLRDRPFWHFTLVVTLLLFTTGLYTIGTAFYAKYTLAAGPTAPSMIFGTVFVIAILSVTVWGRLVRLWGVKKTWLWAIGVMLLSAIALGLASDLSEAIVAAAIAGAGLGGVKVCREMIVATLVDRSLARTGRRQEGVYYSLNRFFGRLSRLLEALALLLLGLLFGYVSGEDPGPNPESAFRFLMSVLPFICMAAALLVARTLRLEADENPAQA